MNVTIGQPISHRIDHMLSGTRANVAVKIFGPDLFELRRLAVAVRDVMQNVAGVVDLSMEQQANIPVITARFDRRALARHGLRTADVGETLEIALRGIAVTQVLERDAAYDLVVRFKSSASQDVDSVGNTLIPTPTGGRVPLHALATVTRERGPNTISREDVQRKIVVMCNVAGRDLRGTVDEIRGQVAATVALPSGYHVEYGGQFESAASASQALLILGVVAVLGIFLLLFVAFRSNREALLVMVNLPLALIGGVIGVFVSGGIISVASIIGFITVFGIATRNGIMMITHFHHLHEHEGVRDIDEVVKRGAAERVAPILMTALAAGLALVPLALSGGQPGAEIETPMAVVILFGLLSSTALNMLVVPPLYRRFGELSRADGPEISLESGQRLVREEEMG
jgi:Cu/Ag efflux pump CusA